MKTKETTKEITKRILDKLVKERSKEEHYFLIKMRYKGSVRDYLLSIGDFKDKFQELIKEKLKQIKNENRKKNT